MCYKCDNDNDSGMDGWIMERMDGFGFDHRRNVTMSINISLTVAIYFDFIHLFSPFFFLV